MTEIMRFNSDREFNKNFPSKLYVCSLCGKLTSNPFFCTNCENQSNNIFYASNTFFFQIGNKNITQIFTPIEYKIYPPH